MFKAITLNQESSNIIPVIKRLSDEWVAEYTRKWKSCEIVHTAIGNNNYLFDVQAGRLIAAWGISAGKNAHKRDSNRMKQSPKGGGDDVHRGHAIPHSMGGDLDINLVPQLGKLNVGLFRVLEIEAVNTPGALYFTNWKYRDSKSQRPFSVDQGLLKPGRTPDIRAFANIMPD